MAERSAPELLPVTLRYFGPIREKTGLSEERVLTASRTPEALYAEIREKYHLEWTLGQMHLAIDGDFRDAGTPLESGDTVVFLPPFGGG